MQKELKKNPFNAWHKQHGGQMVEFAGWRRPLRTSADSSTSTWRRGATAGSSTSRTRGVFVRGKEAVPFLQHVLTNNALALDPGMAQYTVVQSETGGALDDAYLYRLEDEGHLFPERMIFLWSTPPTGKVILGLALEACGQI